jgi:GH25 family lysozyme M1 (1,4-beta-N-acetylmuramidase)
MTIFGWDASDFDWNRGPMDLRIARSMGIDFFTHKATENTNVKHTHYGEAMRRARDAGIPFLGAYHVVRSPANAAAEVAYCLAYANAQTPWWSDFPGWFWQIDLEMWPYDKVPASEGEQFADIIEQRTGRKAIIYASKGQYGNKLTGTSHPLWNADYGPNRSLPFKAAYINRGGDTGSGWGAYSGVTPAIWQYGSQTIIGTQKTCDANAFRGTIGDFARLIGVSHLTSKGDNMEMTDPVPGVSGLTVGQWMADVWRWSATARGLSPVGADGIPLPRTDDRFSESTFQGKTVADIHEIQASLKAMGSGGGLTEADRLEIQSLTEAVTALNNRLASP